MNYPERFSAEPPSPDPVVRQKSWPDYRAVWRWHFYASLFCIPFVVVLSITGAIYLFKPQIESWNERAYDHLLIRSSPRSAAEQITAALAAVPDSTFNAYELPNSDQAAARVIVRQNRAAIRVYVHPETLQVLHTLPENDRFMRWLFRAHGELLLGNRGSLIVELAASWTIVMILTGLYLWWPRQSKGLGGVLYPRLAGGSRVFWRDLHSVTGIWISAFALFLLLSGLPWAKSWGNYLKAARRLTNTAVARQPWTNHNEEPAKQRDGSTKGEHTSHGGSSEWQKPPAVVLSPMELAAVDRIVTAVRPLNLPHPVLISPPADQSQDWAVKSLTANRPYRENLVVNGQTGKIVSRDGFRQLHPIDRLVSIGIAAHEGQLFGWPNQLLGLLTAVGLILICLSGLVLWWQRRDRGVLGAPKASLSPRVSLGLIVLVAALGIYLPLFGISLIIVLLLERTVLRRIPAVRNWLGLSAPGKSGAGSLAALVLVTLLLPGCGGPKPVSGGTPGMLRSQGYPLAEMKVTLYQAEGSGFRLIGFASTGMDGSFQLVTKEARGPLKLPPGNYRYTLESNGSPARIPRAVLKPETTPLRLSWAADDAQLRLDVPFRLRP